MLTMHVADLLKAPPGTTRDVAIVESTAPFGPDLPSGGPVTGSARLLRTQDGIVVRVDLAVSIEVECSRCLEPVTVPIMAHLEEEYRPVVNIMTGTPLPAPDDEALRIDERHTLDLTETARQYLLTALPLQPICSPACRGLCATCGANLNLAPCTCGDELPNSPFASLSSLLLVRPPADGSA